MSGWKIIIQIHYFNEIWYPQHSFNKIYTTFTNFSMEYHLMCKVYTDVGGIK